MSRLEATTEVTSFKRSLGDLKRKLNEFYVLNTSSHPFELKCNEMK